MQTLRELSQEEIEKVQRTALEFREQGLSYSKIVERITEKLNVKVSKATVLRWCLGTHNTFNKMKRINLDSSPALAYIIGVYFGDGTTTKDTNYRYYVKLKVIDKEFADEFEKALRAIGLNPRSGFENDRTRSGRWYVEVTNKSLFMFLDNPKEKLFEIGRAYPREFLRGFFDSEGTVGYSPSSRSIKISATNYDTEVLELSKVLLKELGIHSKIYLRTPKGTPVQIRNRWYQYNKDLYEIAVYRRDSVARFYREVGFSIPRKQEKLRNALYELDEQNHVSMHKNGW